MRRPEKVNITNMCLIYKDDEILVQDRKKEDWPGITFPGGHCELGESFNEAVIREVKEETGLTIHNPILCGIEEFKNDNEVDREIMLFYKTDSFEGQLQSSKEGEVFWIKKDDLTKYQLSLDLLDIYNVMINPKLSEIIYYKNGNEWQKKIV